MALVVNYSRAKKEKRPRPGLQEQTFVDVYSFLIVRAHVVDGRQAQLVLCHVLQVLVETHESLVIVKLRRNGQHIETTDNVFSQE